VAGTLEERIPMELCIQSNFLNQTNYMYFLELLDSNFESSKESFMNMLINLLSYILGINKFIYF